MGPQPDTSLACGRYHLHVCRPTRFHPPPRADEQSTRGVRKSIKIDTVGSYQGKENPIVVLFLVRNNAAGSSECGAATIREGFLSRENRVNVAASRAMDRLLIVDALGH